MFPSSQPGQEIRLLKSTVPADATPPKLGRRFVNRANGLGAELAKYRCAPQTRYSKTSFR
jgi:hypothetical protein